MKRFLLVILLMTGMYALPSSLKAQVYNTAIGGTLGTVSGITYKKFIDQPADTSKIFKAFEINAGYRVFIPFVENVKKMYGTGYGLDAYYLYNIVLSPTWLLHYGFGAGVGVDTRVKASRGMALGGIGVVGFEYVMKSAPFVFGISITPRLDLLYRSKVEITPYLLSTFLTLKYIID